MCDLSFITGFCPESNNHGAMNGIFLHVLYHQYLSAEVYFCHPLISLFRQFLKEYHHGVKQFGSRYIIEPDLVCLI